MCAILIATQGPLIPQLLPLIPQHPSRPSRPNQQGPQLVLVRVTPEGRRQSLRQLLPKAISRKSRVSVLGIRPHTHGKLGMTLLQSDTIHQRTIPEPTRWCDLPSPTLTPQCRNGDLKTLALR